MFRTSLIATKELFLYYFCIFYFPAMLKQQKWIVTGSVTNILYFIYKILCINILYLTPLQSLAVKEAISS